VRRIQSNKAVQLTLSSQDEPAIMSVCLSVSGNFANEADLNGHTNMEKI
jgi:hypothetical protein